MQDCDYRDKIANARTTIFSLLLYGVPLYSLNHVTADR
jgi:hypothetical protein